MQPYLEKMLQALQDPQINGFPVMVPEHKSDVIRALANFPDAKYISEWRYAWGSIVYKYHVHTAKTGEELLRLLKEGNGGKHPTLTGVYAVSELDSILADPVHAESH
jgi:hypothetical protein